MPDKSSRAEEWFLPERRNPDSALSVYTAGNRVEALIDGASYFLKLHEAISATSAGDAVCYAGWRLDYDQELMPGDPSSGIGKTLVEAHHRGVDVRVMLSKHLTNRNGAAHRRLKGAGIQCVLDSRHRALGSAHQKMVVVSRGGELAAFCGGIDVAKRRWDRPGHDSDGWHDVQCHLRGPACHDLYETFRERWNDPRPPSRQEASPSAMGDPPPEFRGVGTHQVQILRTYACDSGYPFAPKGEFTLARACVRAIGLAQRYVYIEDQFFVSQEIADALEGALRLRPNLRVVVVVPQTAIILVRGFDYLREGIIARLAAAGGERFAVYHLRNPNPDGKTRQVYVHSKLMIVDDTWAQVGSMNCNRRSLTHDAEAGVAVLDEVADGVGHRFARNLRLRLWAEHLALDPSDGTILDPAEGFEVWRNRSSQPKVPAVEHVPRRPRFGIGPTQGWAAIYRLGRAFFDPSGCCPGESDPRL